MLITNARVITWAQPNEILDRHAVRIVGGEIRELGPSDVLASRHPGERVLDARGQILAPGNINAHGHFYGGLIRGMAVPGDAPASLPTMLTKVWWPFDKALGEDEVRVSALIGLVDGIRHGTTTIFDHHASPSFIDGSLDVIADAVHEAGLRSVLCYEVTDRDGPDRARAGIEENVRFLSRCARGPVAEGRVAPSFGIHASMTVSEDTLAACREAAPAEAGFHVHVGEHPYDQYRSLALGGKRAVERLAAHDMLNPRTIAAHAIDVDAAEVRLLADARAWVSHQARNNMNVTIGISDVESHQRSGARVCLGTDGLSQTMWREAEFAQAAQKVKHHDSRRLPADRLMEMLVYNNGGLASQYFGRPVGVVAPGAAADLILVDYHAPTPLTPETLPSHVVFGFNESMVTTTVVDGEILMRDRVLQGLDEERIAARARELAPGLWERYARHVPGDPVLA